MHSYTDFDTRNLPSHLPIRQIDQYYRTFQEGNNIYGILCGIAFPLIKEAPNGKVLPVYRLTNNNTLSLWYDPKRKNSYPIFKCKFGSYTMHRIVGILSGAPNNTTYTETDFLNMLTIEHLNGIHDDWNYYNLALVTMNENIDLYTNKRRIERQANINMNPQR